MDVDKSEVDQLKTKQSKLRSLKNKKRRNVILNVITILLAFGGIGWAVDFFYRYYRYEITNDATIEQYITPVNARVSGYISKVNFTEYQKVNEGDTLLLIDDREYRIKLLDAQAALMDAETSGDVLLNADIIKSLSDIGLSEAKETGTGESDAEFVGRHNSPLKSISPDRQKKIKNAQAVILRKRAELELAKLNLSYTVIVAPFTGHVGRRALDVGQYVQAGQTITNIIKDDNKWVIANYREKQIGNIYPGQDVLIRVDAIPNKTFKGKVTAISEATGSKYSLLPVDNSAGNFVKVQQRIPVRIDFEHISAEDMLKLRAGMMVITEAIK